MNVDSQRLDASLNTTQTIVSKSIDAPKKTSGAQSQEKSQLVESSGQNNGLEKKEYTKEQLENAVESVNEFLKAEQTDSKFVFHEGLNQYFVRLVDSKTEEVIKEIPPESLLNAFYEMQKLVGLIVDEKI